MGARDDTEYQHEDAEEFQNARDLGDFARLHREAAAAAGGASSSGQNGAAHAASSSEDQPGACLQTVWPHGLHGRACVSQGSCRQGLIGPLMAGLMSVRAHGPHTRPDGCGGWAFWIAGRAQQGLCDQAWEGCGAPQCARVRGGLCCGAISPAASITGLLDAVVGAA